MKFVEFFEEQKKLQPAVRHDLNTDCQAFIDNMRIWNAMAVLSPEKCEDVIIWSEGDTVPHIEKNPHRDNLEEISEDDIDNHLSGGDKSELKQKPGKRGRKSAEGGDPDNTKPVEGSPAIEGALADVNGGDKANNPAEGGNENPPEPGQQ